MNRNNAQKSIAYPANISVSPSKFFLLCVLALSIFLLSLNLNNGYGSFLNSLPKMQSGGGNIGNTVLAGIVVGAAMGTILGGAIGTIAYPGGTVVGVLMGREIGAAMGAVCGSAVGAVWGYVWATCEPNASYAKNEHKKVHQQVESRKHGYIKHPTFDLAKNTHIRTWIVNEQQSLKQIEGHSQPEHTPGDSEERTYHHTGESKAAGITLYPSLQHEIQYGKRSESTAINRKIENRTYIDQKSNRINNERRFGNPALETFAGKNQKGAILSTTDGTVDMLIIDKKKKPRDSAYLPHPR